jgi:hypothetical protein
MDTRKLMNLALTGVDHLGFRLDELGITNKLNRHNLAAFVMAEQKHLEGEWDSLQARVGRRRAQFDQLTQQVEGMFSPVLDRVNRFRASH